MKQVVSVLNVNRRNLAKAVNEQRKGYGKVKTSSVHPKVYLHAPGKLFYNIISAGWMPPTPGDPLGRMVEKSGKEGVNII